MAGRMPAGLVAQSAKIEAGHVHVPKEAEWLDSFLLELLAFPHGRHDDQVDSVSQFLALGGDAKIHRRRIHRCSLNSQ
jgi:phage terminase large subunit-like protein